ncbi:MAG: pilus assembly protein N-terminal domain-containing protein [Planctomyces sp.]
MASDFVIRSSVTRFNGSRDTGGQARMFLAGALAGFSLLGQIAFGADAARTATGSAGAPAATGAVQVRTVQYQLEQPTVSGQVDAVHSPNVDTLLKPQYKLELERRHSQLVITNRNVRRIAVTDSTIVNYVQYTPKEISIVGLDLGKTDLTLWFEDDETPAIYEITVVRDESLERQRTIDFGRLERRMADLFPNSRVYLIPIGAQVIVQGQAYDAEEAEHILQIVRTEVFRTLQQGGNLDDSNVLSTLGGGGGAGGLAGQNQFGNQGFRDIVVNRLNVPGEYNIKMRVVIAEVNRSQVRNAGFDWNILFNNGRHVIRGSLGGAPGTISGIFENGEIGVFLNWLNSNGTITLLAEPTLVTMSGHTASILGGGEFAVPTTIGLGGGQTTTFRGFGTSLLITPTVIDRDLMKLIVTPEFSSLNAENTVQGIPGTNVKRVSTTVTLREGQTFALGGLISRQTLTGVNRIPLLGDIPYVGSRLFHSKRASEIETELLVLVSPEIVRPMEPDEVPPLPNYYVTHPNDHDLFKYGRSEGNPDTQVYQVPPYGSGSTHGIPQGYSLFNPPVNHGGFAPGAQGGGTMVQGGPMSGFGASPMPQPDHTLPPATYGAPAQQFQSPAVQQFQAAPQSQYPLPPGGGNPSYGAPGQSMPGTPLPPIPQGYPAQGSFNMPKEPAQNPSLMSRMGSVFRKEPAPETGSKIRTAGWTK